MHRISTCFYWGSKYIKNVRGADLRYFDSRGLGSTQLVYSLGIFLFWIAGQPLSRVGPPWCDGVMVCVCVLMCDAVCMCVSMCDGV